MLWRSGRRRVFRSKAYKAWRTAAGWQLKLQKPAKVSGQIAITFAATRWPSMSAPAGGMPRRPA